MKNLFLMVLLCLFSSTNYGQTKEYATFEADITNLNEPIYLMMKDKVVKKFVKNSDGVYKDTLKVVKGNYRLFDGKQYTLVSLDNNSDLKLKMDANNIDKTIVFSGVGSEMNNYIAQSAIAIKKIDIKGLFLLDEIALKKKIEEMEQSDKARIDKYIVDPQVNATMKKEIGVQYAKLEDVIKKNKETLASRNKERELKNAELNKMNGTLSPSFNYRNYKGIKTKLEDFKGKYVYIDLWATWCGPCIKEIPFLQTIEQKYHNKNIVFVSISIDKQTDFKKWETMVKEKNLGGVQLIADNDWNSEFAKSFGVTSIPRFILIDPSGKVVKAVAERPSNPQLIKELDVLLN
ncbi:TlpA family protein disulfide reductase [Flavobacterium eburneipallidum]|uniref:TlpA family protein disulfide reductase n=1 Tax=Flavobacterium eburneipallidum TaxID=3003263 RepID=UPI002483002D|nr:TlpA disulfide reductase family protein [Flavobacterium eburneipallidum]